MGPSLEKASLVEGSCTPGLWLPVCSDGLLHLFLSQHTLSCDVDVPSSVPSTWAPSDSPLLR